MISQNDIIKLNISKEDIIEAINISKNEFFIDNLRNRNSFVAFDSKVRGNIGEIALKKWCKDNHLIINDEGHDSCNDHGNVDLNIYNEKLNRNIKCEIKTSKVPNVCGNNLYNCLNKCDVKIFKHSGDIVKDLERDAYIQIYYDLNTKIHDTFLKNKSQEFPNLLFENAELIYNTLNYDDYVERCYFVGWVSNKKVIVLNKTYNEHFYSIEKKQFWYCHIKDIYSPKFLAECLAPKNQVDMTNDVQNNLYNNEPSL